MNHKRLSKFLVISVISLFIISCFAPLERTSVQADDEWVAHPMHIVQSASPMNSPSGYSPSQIKTAYGLPSSGGAGATIAIIDAYDTPSILSDLTAFSNQFSLPTPVLGSNFEIHKMSTSIGIASNSWATEACLDVEWAHAIAPDAKILLVEATDTGSNLLSAVDYAVSRPDVVAISMSWGGAEFSRLTQYDFHFTSSYGAVFFASSGDSGSGVIWPAISSNVVAVGGTTLNLNTTEGTVISETAWSKSGGGVSVYEPIPSYQTSYGLTTSKRSIPDVSYDADPSTGVAVCYNSGWLVIGGTSAGAPQWAAIQALGRSASNANLYLKAKTAYSSYFRDIINGTNGGYTAGLGYDDVTGLGSPLTDNFNSTLTVSPTSGPAGGVIALNGVGFTAGSSVNISYLNPLNSTWISAVNNFAVASQNFTYTFNAPDLLQNNPLGDNNPPTSDNIVFRAQDNSNGNSYNTTVPYTEWRRGLTQVGSTTATGLYGNNTNLATTVFVQNGQSLVVAGEWFSPGTASFLWDGTTNLGTAPIDGTGLFNGTVFVPNTTAGQHTLTINDGVSTFSVNITRLTTVANDYDGLWHATSVIINLAPDFNVTQTYYRINNGPIENVSANGQPFISSEGSDNTLEYWSTWDIYGTGAMELPHVTLTGIQLQTTPPAGSMLINGGDTSTSSSNVTLTVSATDSLSGISQIRFSNDGTWDQATWEQYTNTVNWQLTSGDGAKTVYCQIQDNAGLITTLSSSIILSNPQPMSNPSPLTTTIPSPTPIPPVTPSPSANVISSPSPIISSSPEPSATPQTPELSIQIVFVLLALSTILFVVNYKRKPHIKQ